MMLRIGDFSRLTQVTIKALRHYDSLGLLKPAYIDPESGYRYYVSSQLPRLNRIVALKEMGFSLEQIGQLLDAELSTEQMHGMLLAKQQEVRDQIAAEQQRLSRIESRLLQIEGGVAARYDVVLKRTEPYRVASIRGLLPRRSAIGQLFRELRGLMQTHGVSGSPHMTIWHDADFRDCEVDAEAAVVTDDPVPAESGISCRILPEVETMACVVHHGPPETIGDGCQALLTWIEANGYRLDGPERVVLIERAGGPGQGVVEMQYPVVQAMRER